MDQRRVGGRIAGEVAQQPGSLADEPARDQVRRRQWCQPLGPLRAERAQPTQLGERRPVQPAVQPGHHLAGRLDVERAEVAVGARAFQQQREPVRIGPPQLHGPVTLPGAQREVFGLGLPVRPGQLQDGAPVVLSEHRHHQRTAPSDRRPVDPQSPLVNGFVGQPRHPAQPGSESGQIPTAGSQLRRDLDHPPNLLRGGLSGGSPPARSSRLAASLRDCTAPRRPLRVARLA